jgi:nucleoside phosphorylase
MAGRKGVCRIGVITVVPEEFVQVLSQLHTTTNIAGSQYYVPALNLNSTYDLVVMRLADRGNIAALEGARDLIEDFRPSYIFLVGIGGGIAGRDGTGLGDVIVADFVDYYEFRKIVDGENQIRRNPYDHPSLRLRHSVAEQIGEKWKARVTIERPKVGKLKPKLGKPKAETPKVIFGNIISGEKVLGDPTNKEQRRILKEFDKALAVDMESYGLARAVFHARASVQYNPQYLVVRGISDLVDKAGNNATRKLWRSYAANTAAAFAAEVIERMLSMTD